MVQQILIYTNNYLLCIQRRANTLKQSHLQIRNLKFQSAVSAQLATMAAQAFLKLTAGSEQIFTGNTTVLVAVRPSSVSEIFQSLHI